MFEWIGIILLKFINVYDKIEAQIINIFYNIIKSKVFLWCHDEYPILSHCWSLGDIVIKKKKTYT